ncbi:hypothetical protein BGX38DRAFT_1326124 [Terfezia claveryi]|nr:hypothetical protein BGX38DRAFT_1326124 [Terfezia claveryi]
MASRTDSNTLPVFQKAPKVTKLPTKPGSLLKRLACLIYLYLKPKDNRSPSEHILFMEVMSIIDLMTENEKASMLIPRTTRNRVRPITPTPKEIQDFNSMRSTFCGGGNSVYDEHVSGVDFPDLRSEDLVTFYKFPRAVAKRFEKAIAAALPPPTRRSNDKNPTIERA